jgi:DNA-binding PadR family transcriptional regulator
MQEPTFLILTALAAEPAHGYGVIRAVEELSQGEVVLRPGTLYGALDRLTEQGLIAVDREESVDGRLRRYYKLTDAGTAALVAQVQRLRRNADAAAARLRLAFGAAPPRFTFVAAPVRLAFGAAPVRLAFGAAPLRPAFAAALLRLASGVAR